MPTREIAGGGAELVDDLECQASITFGLREFRTRIPDEPIPYCLRGRVAYPLLRVEIEKVEVERVGGLPPRFLRPMSIEPPDLYIDRHIPPFGLPKQQT